MLRAQRLPGGWMAEIARRKKLPSYAKSRQIREAYLATQPRRPIRSEVVARYRRGVGDYTTRLILQKKQIAEEKKTVLDEKKGLVRKNRKLAETIKREPVTGLYNWTHFKKIWRRWKRAADNDPKNVKLAVGTFDLDWFKSINKSYGWNEGTNRIVNTGRMLRMAAWKVARRDAIVCRAGGEEFSFAVRGKNPMKLASAIAVEFRRMIAESSMPHKRTPSGIMTVTGGIAAYTPGVRHQPTFIADAALRVAKKAGRDTVYIGVAHGKRNRYYPMRGARPLFSKSLLMTH